MFWNRKSSTQPLGVALADLIEMLAPTSIKATLRGNSLIAQHEHYTVRLEVIPPMARESDNGPIKAVVRVISDLPARLFEMFRGRESSVMAASLNAFAALSALYPDGQTIRGGSRLTIYEAEDAWSRLHLPLLAFSTICGTEAILGGFRRSLGNEKASKGASRWTTADLAQVQGYLSRVCMCTAGDLGLTAEFGLADGPGSALLEDSKTALFRLMAIESHPELGGGLFCQLQMPHRIHHEERLARVCLQLNQMEMAAHDLPPHFGGWCPGRQFNNPVYVSFLPNSLHEVPGVALNFAIWAMHRAQFANAMLASLGAGLDRG